MQRQITYLPAILWVLLSTALWTLIFAAAKFADGSVSTFQITLLRYAGAFGALLVLARYRGGLAAHKSNQPWTHFLRALCGSSAAVAITWASAHMPIADATAIGMLYGVLVVLLGVIVLKEHVGRRHWLAIAISVAGAGVVMSSQGAFHASLPPGATVAALASAALFAVEGLLIRILGRSERAMTVMLHVCFFGFCLMIVPAYATWQHVGPGTTLACLLLGPVAIIAQYCTIRGYRSAPLSIVGPVDYSWLVFAAFLGLLAFGELPSAGTIAGGMLIMGGGVLLARINAGKS